MILDPTHYYTNENGVVELLEKNNNIWTVRWIKWPHVVYDEELPEAISEDELKKNYQKVTSLSIDDKCGCVRVSC